MVCAPVLTLNDADAFAAGIAATRGHLDTLIRVWTLGSGVGFGRYPSADGIWEGGHVVVSLDPKEKYCGCGGIGHLEGIVGRRGMRQRFLDLEPEEVFANAAAGDRAVRGLRATCGIARWPRPPRPAFTSKARVASSCPVPMRRSSICTCSIATCTRW